MKVKVLVLTNGTRIIGQVEDTDYGYRLEKWAHVDFQAVEGGLMPIFIPLDTDMSTNESVEISKNHVLYTLDPKEGLENGYRKQTGQVAGVNAGVVLPS